MRFEQRTELQFATARAEEILEELGDRELLDLNDWETTFCDDIELQLDEGRPITERQLEKLEEILAEKG